MVGPAVGTGGARDTMRAVVVRALRGTPELIEVPKPTPEAGEYLIRMGAAGMNPFDQKLANGLLDGKMSHVFPLILGVDGAGTVERLGDGVRRFAVGDSIYGQFFRPPVGKGTYAEYATVPERLAVSKAPRSVDVSQAAAVPTAGMTALYSLDVAGLTSGQSVLIVGATGGVGSFATLLASRRGLRVIATAGPDAEEYVRSLGAEETVDYRKEPVVPQLRKKYPEGVDAVLDFASEPEAFAANASLVRRGGAALTSRGAAKVDELRQAGIRGVNIDLEASVALLDRMTKEIDEGGLRIPLGSKIPLEKAAEAFAHLQSHGARGKTVIVL
jgi:NADPH:quinone reductase-like Zn-dependent oxidoreductase